MGRPLLLHPLQCIFLSFLYICFLLMFVFTFQPRAAPTLSFASSLLWPLAFPRVWPPSSPRCPSAAPALTAPSPGVQGKGWAPSDLSLRYSGSRLMWSLWASPKVITLTAVNNKRPLSDIKYMMAATWDLVKKRQIDHINWMITLSVITLSGFHCITNIH